MRDLNVVFIKLYHDCDRVQLLDVLDVQPLLLLPKYEIAGYRFSRTDLPNAAAHPTKMGLNPRAHPTKVGLYPGLPGYGHCGAKSG